MGQTEDAVTVDFEVLRCVSAVGGCRTITFTNPADNPALRFRYQVGNDDSNDDTKVNRNLLGLPWNMVRAALPHLKTGDAIVCRRMPIVSAHGGEHCADHRILER